VLYSAQRAEDEAENTSAGQNGPAGYTEESMRDPRFLPFKKPYYFIVSGAGFYVPKYGFVGGGGLSFNYHLKGKSMMDFPKILLSVNTFATSDFFNEEIALTFFPSRFVSFEIAPFYLTGWRFYNFDISNKDNASRTKDRLKANDVSFNSSFGLKTTLTLNFFFIALTNTLTLYNFKNRTYLQKEAFLVKDDFIWSPKVMLRFRLARKLNMSLGYRYSRNLSFHGYSHSLLVSFFVMNIYSTVSINFMTFLKVKASDSKMSIGAAPFVMAKF
jgi:hypothetical protein